MDKLTDLEICKKIAEIEGITVVQVVDERQNKVYLNHQTAGAYGIVLHGEYNPLTDDALCFRLQFKHKITCEWLWDENDGTPHYIAYSSEEVDSDNECKYSKSPNHAICLAIIAVSEGR